MFKEIEFLSIAATQKTLALTHNLFEAVGKFSDRYSKAKQVSVFPLVGVAYI